MESIMKADSKKNIGIFVVKQDDDNTHCELFEVDDFEDFPWDKFYTLDMITYNYVHDKVFSLGTVIDNLNDLGGYYYDDYIDTSFQRVW